MGGERERERESESERLRQVLRESGFFASGFVGKDTRFLLCPASRDDTKLIEFGCSRHPETRLAQDCRCNKLTVFQAMGTSNRDKALCLDLFPEATISSKGSSDGRGCFLLVLLQAHGWPVNLQFSRTNQMLILQLAS